MLDISLLYYLTDACTTTDNNPGAGQYTHTYANSATHVNPPKSIELMHVVNNDTSAESFIELFTGVIVKSYNEKGGGLLDSAITGTWEMEGRNIISGTALTTPGYPAVSSLRAFRFADAVLTWTKGGVVSDGYMLGYEFNWTSDKSTIKSGGYYPVNSLAPKSVKPMLTVQWLPQETDSYDDSQDDHTSAQVKIVSVKISRDTTLDYHSYAFVNAFQKLQDNPSWEAGNLVERHEFQMNPHESGSTFTIIEQNLFDDDRYET